MPISVSCPACQRSLALPDDLAGQRVACPYCAAAVSVSESGSLSPSGWQPSPSPVATGDVNPFQSPVSGEPRAEAHVTPRGPIRPSPLDLGDALAIAWERYHERFGLTVGAFIITGILQAWPGFVIQFGGRVLINLDPSGVAFWLSFVIVQVAGFLMQAWIGVGWWRFMLGVIRRDAVTLGDLFVPAELFVRSLLANLLYLGVVLGVGAVCFAPVGIYRVLVGPGDEEFFGLVAGAVLTWFIMVVLGLIYGLYLAAIADGVPGVIEAYRVSARITRGNRLTLFALFVVAGIIGILGACACYIGMLFTMPMTWLTVAAAYLLMSGQIERAR